MKIKFFFLFIVFSSQLFGQLTITVTSIPDNTPTSDNIFIAGNFQNWNPSDLNYELNDIGNDQFQIVINPNAGLLEFKFTRGNWDSVEGNENGGFFSNRTYTYDGTPSSLDLSIASWEDLNSGNTGNSTAAENVHLLDDNFYMPQLDRNRRIWIYLPPDYESSNKYYPVLYMHDGQNLFDIQTSFSGEWEVDESLNELFDQGDHGAIVVGIDNGGALRMNELSPWPHIDANYRTLSEPEHTVLFGSSLGGLISQYGLMQRQDVFAKAGVFSPAFWFNPEVFNHSETTNKVGAKKIYMLAGIPEGNGSVVDDVNQMEEALNNNGFTNEEFSKAFHTDGAHSEWYWAREFRWAYLWLFDGMNLTAVSEVAEKAIRLYPNPADSIIQFSNFPDLRRPIVRIVGIDGKEVYRKRLRDNQVDVSNLKPGSYILNIRARRGFRFSRKIIVN